jgi:hypothetical protein
MLDFIQGYYEHKRTGVKYKTLIGRESDGLVMSKDNVNREWNPSVMYHKENEENIYTRELRDFNENFELIQKYLPVVGFQQEIEE